MEELKTMEAQKNETLSTGKEWFFLAALLLWGYLFVLWLPLPYLGIRVTLFVFSAVAVSYAYLRVCGKTPVKASYLSLGVLALLALSFSLFENSGMKPLLFLLLFGLFAEWLLHAAQARPLDGRDVGDSLSLLLIHPFSHLQDKVAAFSIKKHSHSQAKSVLLGALVTLPVLAVASALLVASDENFSRIVQSVAGSLFDGFGATFVRLVLACIIGSYLLSMLISAASLVERKAPAAPAQANATIMSMLIGALCALYAAFVAVQGMSVAGVLSQQVRGASFYSAYARDGFFELCAVTVLNFAVFLVAHIFRKDITKSMRILLTTLGGFTQALIVIAIVKMSLYMNHYGLTLLRVQTLWFMVSLFLTFAVLIALQWKKFDGFKCVAMLATVSILAISYTNIGGLVARVNVDRYLSGSLTHLSIDQYGQFPYEAAPHLIRGYQGINDPEEKLRIAYFLTDINEREDVGALNESVQQILARAELKAFCEEQFPARLGVE